MKEASTIIVSKITKFGNKGARVLKINITNMEESQKAKLRGAIKFFAGDRNNIAVKIKNGDNEVMSGGIFLNDEILNEFRNIAGYDKVIVEE